MLELPMVSEKPNPVVDGIRLHSMEDFIFFLYINNRNFKI